MPNIKKEPKVDIVCVPNTKINQFSKKIEFVSHEYFTFMLCRYQCLYYSHSVVLLYGVLLLWICHHSFLCNGMVLYVKPTESLDTPVCDSNLCHSLDTYAKQSKEYFKSNVTFVLLPGNHTLSDPLVVSNVTNFTFRGVDSTYVLGVASSVKIICNHSYIIFKHSIKLTIQNLTLYGCGVHKVSENKASESDCIPTNSFMHGSDFCKLTSSLNFNRVLNLKVTFKWNTVLEYLHTASWETALSTVVHSMVLPATSPKKQHLLLPQYVLSLHTYN